MNSKIFKKQFAVISSILLLSSLILGSTFIILFRNHTININKTNMEQNAYSIANTLTSFNEGKKGGYGGYLKLLDNLDVGDVWVIDANLKITTRGIGKKIVNYGELPNNADIIIKDILKGKPSYTQEFSGLIGVNALTVGVPIISDDNIVGAVLVHSPISGVDEAVMEGLKLVIISTLLSLVISGFIAGILSYRLTKPLLSIKNSAIDLTEGNYTNETGIKSNDEIGDLAKIIDILSGKLNEANIKQLNIDKTRKQFIANISHELRTPVAVLVASLELLNDDVITDSKEKYEYYNKMIIESKNLEKLINNLLELSILEDSEFKLDIEEIELRDVVKDVIRLMKVKAKSKNIKIKFTHEKGDYIINGNYDRIRELVVILVDNAIKFSYKNKNILIKLSNKDKICLEVSDFGRGIKEEDSAFIFDRFHKTNDKNNKSGTGLGLAVASEIVKIHNAKISVSSYKNPTTFIVFFDK